MHCCGVVVNCWWVHQKRTNRCPVLLLPACVCLLFSLAQQSEVPPGKYLSQGLVRICPQGFFRELYLGFDNSNATLCLPCASGITTEGGGAGLQSLCNRVLPGYGIGQVFNVSSPADAPLYPQAGPGGLPTALLCDVGFYALNGFCAQCPRATTTKAKGALSVEECGEWVMCQRGRTDTVQGSILAFVLVLMVLC